MDFLIDIPIEVWARIPSQWRSVQLILSYLYIFLYICVCIYHVRMLSRTGGISKIVYEFRNFEKMFFLFFLV